MKNIDKLLEGFSRGETVVVFDHLKRENEADLITAIEQVTADKINFLITKARGLVCAALDQKLARQIGLPLMPSSRNDPHGTAFTLSVDSIKTKTGISARERCLTARQLIEPGTVFKDFISPGHLFPLIAREGGILERKGHTEAAVTLCQWAGLKPAALICEMVHQDGSMYCLEAARQFARQHQLAFCTIEELAEYQRLHYCNIKKIASAGLPTAYGDFKVTVYEEIYTGREHLFLSMGSDQNGPVRIHSECLTGDVFSSRTCDCQSQLHASLELIAREKKGAVVYLRQEGRGIGLGEKIKAYALQQQKGLDTIQANLDLGHAVDLRDYHQAAWILKKEGYKKVSLITNNPRKIEALEKHHLQVNPINLPSKVYSSNIHYLSTKKNKLGHRLQI